MNLQSSLIYNHQKLEAAQMSISCWIDKQVVVYKMEYYWAVKGMNYTTDMCDDTDKSHMHSAKWKKPFSEGYILCDSIYLTFGKGRSHIMIASGPGGQIDCKGTEGAFVIELFCVLVMVGNHTFVKTHQTVMQKGELYCV